MFEFLYLKMSLPVMTILGIIGVLAFIFAITIIVFIVYLVKEKKAEGNAVKNDIILKNSDTYINDFAKIIKYKTIADGNHEEEFEKMRNELKAIFPLTFKSCEVDIVDGSISIRYISKNPTKSPIILMGHQDVVSADESRWTHPPYEGVIKDHVLYGRGAIDCKCNVFCILRTFENLLEEKFEPNFDIYFNSSNDEETNGSGAAKLVDMLDKRNVKPAFVLDEGGAVLRKMSAIKNNIAFLGISEKGYVDVKVSATSKGGHSSMPPNNTPIVRLSKFIVKFEKKKKTMFKQKMIKEIKEMFYKSGFALNKKLFIGKYIIANFWLFSPMIKFIIKKQGMALGLYGATCVPTVLEDTNNAMNVIPNKASIIINCRICEFEKSHEVAKKIEKLAKKYNLECEIIAFSEASSIADIESSMYKLVENCIYETFENTIVAPYFMLGATDCKNYQKLTDNTLRFSPIDITVGQMKGMHGIDESIDEEAIIKAVKFYQYLIKKYNE